MRYDCGPTYAEREEAAARWHHWFAWHPVRIASHSCAWLETIERRCIGYYYEGGRQYEYRLLTE